MGGPTWLGSWVRCDHELCPAISSSLHAEETAAIEHARGEQRVDDGRLPSTVVQGMHRATASSGGAVEMETEQSLVRTDGIQYVNGQR